MSFIAKLFFPKMPDVPKMVLPEVKDTPSYEDEDRKKEAAEEERKRALKRRGRRSTILTGNTGLNQVEDENIEYKGLLGE